MDFAKQLRIVRIARGVTQKELCTAAGVPEALISFIESGKIMPQPHIEAKLRAALSWPAEADEAFRILATPSEAFEAAFIDKAEAA